MRTIKFRGKCKEGGFWVYGNVTQESYKGGSVWILEPQNATPFDEDLGYHFVEVFPETIGQFTGLHDKDGREIYEGDVVRFTVGDESTDCFVWYKNGGFMVESDGFFGAEEYDITTIGYAIDEMDETLLLGNIHDNPELA